jgi:hypothetical protein
MVRVAFAIVGLVAGGFMLANTPGTSQTRIPIPQVPPADVDPKMPYFTVCAKECDDCARLCDICAAHSTRLLAEGKKDRLAIVQLCEDCAAICSAASRVTAKDGPMADLICASCADACKRCADACEKLEGDPIVKHCAEECRKCEKTCREMLKTAKSAAPNVGKQPK